MFSMMLKYVRWLVAGLALVTFLLLAYFASISFVAFQKTIAIVPYDLDNLVLPKRQVGALDVSELIQAIPYSNNASMIYDVNPQDRYYRSIRLGYGNCSNLAFGMAYYLAQKGQAYQVVHFMPYEGFLKGVGHTVVNMPYILDGAPRVGIVDILEGGLPKIGEQYVDLSSLRKKALQGLKIFPLSARKDNVSPYYEDFLNNSVVGVVKSDEIESYFKFVKSIYFPFGSKKLERILFNGLAIVVGVYPRIYVDQKDCDVLFAPHFWLKVSADILLFSLRILPIGIGLWVILGLLNRLTLRKKINVARQCKSKLIDVV